MKTYDDDVHLSPTLSNRLPPTFHPQVFWIEDYDYDDDDDEEDEGDEDGDEDGEEDGEGDYR